MMGRVRIRAKAPAPVKVDGMPTVQRLADWSDVIVSVVSEDGTETPLHGVRSLSFVASDDDGEPLVATLTCLVDELDLEVLAQLPETPEPPKVQAS